ncbi:MAG: ABC transporter permease [Eubacteriaceae bacterium]|jgi:putative ABC transport system permease protein
MIRESINMTWQNIMHNKMRSFLTVLGIVIGVAAVISLITIVNGVQAEMMNQFSSLGANTITVQAGGSALKQGVTDDELSQIAAIDGVNSVAPSVTANVSVVANGEKADKVSVEGQSAAYFQKESDLVTSGRAILQADVDNKTNVCIVNQDFVDEYMKGEDPIGKKLIIGGIEYEIVGLAGTSTSVTAAMTGQSKTVMIPYKNALELSGTRNITSFSVYIDPNASTDDVISEVEAKLDAFFNYKDDTYTVINLQSMLDMMSKMQTLLQEVLAGVASISLLVGGIGIMNMMLVSVSERTVEIGLRKALGARPSDIQMQFLLEAVILSITGGFIGLLLGLGISVLAASLIGMPFVLSGFAIALGVGFSAAVGIIFGWAPARKASRLSPIDALRSN